MHPTRLELLAAVGMLTLDRRASCVGTWHIIDTSDRVLENTKEEYDEWKAWIDALPPTA